MGILKDLLPLTAYNYINNFTRDLKGKPKKTYSGEGEDLIIQKVLHGVKNGTYVDVGCYHPKVGSNTYALYKKGWSGINIDPNTNTIFKFNKYRPSDININLGVSNTQTELKFYRFTEPAINTFSEDFNKLRIKQGATPIPTTTIKVDLLQNILDKHLNGRHIDVLDIDVEGLDIDVLKSNNWDKYKPTLILIEDQEENIKSIEDLPSNLFLKQHGYSLKFKTFSTAFYLLNNINKAILNHKQKKNT